MPKQSGRTKPPATPPACICPEVGVHLNCPVHGGEKAIRNVTLGLMGSVAAAGDQAHAMTDAQLAECLLTGKWTTGEVHEAGRRLSRRAERVVELENALEPLARAGKRLWHSAPQNYRDGVWDDRREMYSLRVGDVIAAYLSTTRSKGDR